jgi:hypothetical protein
MVQVPLASVICSQTIMSDRAVTSNARVYKALQAANDDTDRIMLYLIRERALGALGNSSWWPYMDVLPRVVPVPATWNSHEVGLLQWSDAIGDARKLRRQIVRSYNRLLPSIREVLWDINLAEAAAAYAAHELGVSIADAKALGYGDSGSSSGRAQQPAATPAPEAEDAATVDAVDLQAGATPTSAVGLPGFGFSHDSLQSWTWASLVLDSRALTLQGRRYLVPFADMLNYSPAPGAEIREKTGGDAFLHYHRLERNSNGGGSFRVLVDRPVQVGAQVWEDYGDSDNGIYLQHHGFVATAAVASAGNGPDPAASMPLSAALSYTGNPMDCVYLSLPPLRTPARRELAQALRLRDETYSRVCIQPPRVPTGATAASAVLPADPIPLGVHRWLALVSMTAAELEACKPVLQAAELANTRSGAQEALEAARKCFSETDINDDADAAASDASDSEDADAADDAAESSHAANPAKRRRDRILRLLRRTASALNTTIADDEYLLAKLVGDPVTMTTDSSKAAKRVALLDTVAAPRARSVHSIMAVSFRITRKRMLETIKQYYARTGPFARSTTATSASGSVNSAAAAVPSSAAPATPAAPTTTITTATDASAATTATNAARKTANVDAFTATASTTGGVSDSIAIGLTFMSPRDAAAYFTEAEHEAVAAQCDSFNAWILSHR